MKKLLTVILFLALTATGCDDLKDLFNSEPDPVPKTYVLDGVAEDEFLTAELPKLRLDFEVMRSQDLGSGMVILDITECRQRVEDPCPDLTQVDEEVRVYGTRVDEANQIFDVDRVVVLHD